MYFNQHLECAALKRWLKSDFAFFDAKMMKNMVKLSNYVWSTCMTSDHQTARSLYETKNAHFSIIFLNRKLAKICKNVRNTDFDQHLKCAAPKCWSKYTTAVSEVTEVCNCMQII